MVIFYYIVYGQGIGWFIDDIYIDQFVMCYQCFYDMDGIVDKGVFFIRSD